MPIGIIGIASTASQVFGSTLLTALEKKVSIGNGNAGKGFGAVRENVSVV
jgi:hypothetical protein